MYNGSNSGYDTNTQYITLWRESPKLIVYDGAEAPSLVLPPLNKCELGGAGVPYLGWRIKKESNRLGSYLTSLKGNMEICPSLIWIGSSFF